MCVCSLVNVSQGKTGNVNSLLLPCVPEKSWGVLRSYLGHQAWQQVPIYTELSLQLTYIIINHEGITVKWIQYNTGVHPRMFSDYPPSNNQCVNFLNHGQSPLSLLQLLSCLPLLSSNSKSLFKLLLLHVCRCVYSLH